MNKEQIFDTGEVKLNYFSAGTNGIPILHLHGGTSNWSTIIPMIPHFKVKNKVYAKDFRGYGKSERKDPKTYNFKIFAEDTIKFIEECIKEPCIIFGASMGGIIALIIGVNRPDLVKGIIVGDSPIDIQEFIETSSDMYKGRTDVFFEVSKKNYGTCWEILNELLTIKINISGQPTEPFATELSPFLMKLAKSLKLIDSEIFNTIWSLKHEIIDGYDMKDTLQAILCPVLLIQANPELGGVMTNSMVKKALELLKNGYHLYLNEIGHGGHADKPYYYFASIFPFIEMFNG